MLNERLEDLYLRKIKQRYEEIGRYLYSNITPIEGIELRETLEFEKYQDAVTSEGYRPIKVGENWGGNGKSGWFKIRFALPPSFAGKPSAALINIGFEGCVFVDGAPHQGVDRWHEEVLLAEKSEPGAKYELVIEAMSGEYWQNRTEPAVFKRAEIATINREVNDYWYALGFLLQLAETLPEKSVRRARLIRGLNKSVNLFDLDNTDEDSLRQSAIEAYDKLKPLLEKKAEPSALNLTCTGHAHIDVAWLWPYAETIRKCSRTFSTAIRYMEQYPDYVFSQSQPQLYEFSKEHYPKLYEQIVKRVKEGRWEPVGGMWVESDTNLPSGESLVRQLVYGKRFFQDEFGIEVNNLWLPDVFGYSGALPQILKKVGVEYFTTIKLIWGNQFNKIPYSSFWWQGIDGTCILTHMPPHGDYNSQIRPDILRKAQDDYAEKDRSEHVLYQFGWGDGGGGPDKTHLERLKLAKDLEGLPKCIQRPSAEFFADLKKEADSFPTWRGELYFELHRGTYTSQARTKKNNRKAEFALRDAEILSAAAMTFGASYPAADLEKAWKTVLKNQFHDVIPGSSVGDVYIDAEKDYAEVFQITGRAAQDAETCITDKIDTTGPGQPIVVFNTLSWDRDVVASAEITRFGRYQVVDSMGVPVPSQISKDGSRLHFMAHVPAIGYAVYHIVKEEVDQLAESGSGVTISPTHLENRFFSIELDDQGLITSIFDKRIGRDLIPVGAAANLFQLFDDRPLDWEAWDIDFFYKEKEQEITGIEFIEIDELGPIQGSLKLVRKFGNSTVEQKIVIYSDIPRIDFVTDIDWQENKKLLKVAFPVTVNSPTARYEIQFGNLERPTHSSTSWDFARFEVSAHKWADLSEGGYGISLLNDCKYGYDIHDGVMKLTLLRAPTIPDPVADRGKHSFTYSLYPHEGNYTAGGTVRAGYELNVPVRVVSASAHPGQLPKSMSLFRLDSDHVVLDTVKKSDTDDSVILRFYEAHNKRGRVNLLTDIQIKDACECDLLEREIGKIDHSEGVIGFDIAPFEIKTVKISVR